MQNRFRLPPKLRGFDKPFDTTFSPVAHTQLTVGWYAWDVGDGETLTAGAGLRTKTHRTKAGTTAEEGSRTCREL